MLGRALRAGRLENNNSMSQKSNVNPDHYKQAGRGRQGQDVVHEVERQKFKEQAGSPSGGSSRKRSKGELDAKKGH
jgi:hypothetical protein